MFFHYFKMYSGQRFQAEYLNLCSQNWTQHVYFHILSYLWHLAAHFLVADVILQESAKDADDTCFLVPGMPMNMPLNGFTTSAWMCFCGFKTCSQMSYIFWVYIITPMRCHCLVPELQAGRGRSKLKRDIQLLGLTSAVCRFYVYIINAFPTTVSSSECMGLWISMTSCMGCKSKLISTCIYKLRAIVNCKDL